MADLKTNGNGDSKGNGDSNDDVKHNRRKQDSWVWKISYLGGMAIAIAAIGFVLMSFGNTQWQKKDKADLFQEQTFTKLHVLEQENADMKATMKSTNKTLDNMQKSLERIEDRVYGRK